MNTDRDIVARILAGDVRQFGVLVDRYKDRAFSLASRLLGNREDAEETVQDAFVRAYRSLAEFRGESQFGTWFYRILYNACVTRISRRRTSGASLDEIALAGGEYVIASAEQDALEHFVAEERHEIFSAELQKLPERYRTVMLLFYFEEQRYEEIASVLQITVSSVKTHLFRGRSLLRKRLMERYNDEVRAA